MEDKEKKAIQKTTLDLIKDLNVLDVAPFLFENEFLLDFEYEELCQNNNTPRRKLCQRLLSIITSPSSRCTFNGLLAALRYENVYSFLADKLETNLQTLHNILNENNNDFIPHRNSSTEERLSGEQLTRHTETATQAQIFEPVRKIDVFNENRPKIAELAHSLKRYSHNGDVDKFRQIVSQVERIFNKNKLDGMKNIRKRMGFADMRFTALEAESSFKRVQYDVTLYENPLFREMESVIPYTTNPRVSSMTYLARYGSAISMLESLDNGLAILQYSKHHAEHVVPCKETGMVYYIEVNLLSQKYQKEPNKDLKMEILKTAELAMSQFTGEDEHIKKDYQRMLMLKMVFCRLGIGLFGNKIENAELDEADKDAAKDYLEFIERPDVWCGMEKRRKMLYWVAKSELFRQREQYDLALPPATAAAKLAEENNWKAELPNLMKRLTDLEYEKNLKHSQTRVSNKPDPLSQWLDGFEDDDDDEAVSIEESQVGSINCVQEETHDKRETTAYTPNIDYLKLPGRECRQFTGLPEMLNLKGLSSFCGENDTCSVFEEKPYTNVEREPANNATDMDLLKQQNIIGESTAFKQTRDTEMACLKFSSLDERNSAINRDNDSNKLTYGKSDLESSSILTLGKESVSNHCEIKAATPITKDAQLFNDEERNLIKMNTLKCGYGREQTFNTESSRISEAIHNQTNESVDIDHSKSIKMNSLTFGPETTGICEERENLDILESSSFTEMNLLEEFHENILDQNLSMGTPSIEVVYTRTGR